MSNVVPFPIARSRPTGLPPASFDDLADKSPGEILLFTGIRYMRRPTAAAPAREAQGQRMGEELQG